MVTELDKCIPIMWAIDHWALSEWISAIPLEDWPQQEPGPHGLRPAMCHDPEWHDFGARVQTLLFHFYDRFPKFQLKNPMLSIVMPGDDIHSHSDQLGPDWLGRIHVPLITNKAAKFIIEDEVFHLECGCAYTVDISRIHSVVNNGGIPRIHFMIDRYRGIEDGLQS